MANPGVTDTRSARRPGGRAGSRRILLLGALALALGACAGPISVTREDPTVVLQDLSRSAVTTGEPSWPARNVLFEYGLFEAFDERPAAAIEQLHRTMVAAGGDPEILFALAELSFLHARATTQRQFYLASAVYAWAVLFPDGLGPTPGRFDPRARVAAVLYNWAITAGLTSEDGEEVVLHGGTFELPFGRMEVRFDPAQLWAGDRTLHRFVAVGELQVQGMDMRYRWPGLGAPLAGSIQNGPRARDDLLAPRLRVPATALLRIDRARHDLVHGRPLRAILELYLAWDAESITIGDERVPLEGEPTAALALTLSGAPVTEVELFGFLGRLRGFLRERPPLVSTTPYKRGLIPVVFVHGTASSVVRWAEMFNRLQADVEIRRRYQFWFFQYDSGNPIALSALRLREALQTATARLDPMGTDAALRRMVLVGHSQGGLLVKMQAISAGDRLWNAASSRPLEELTLSDESRDMFRRGLFVEPLPGVARVVFIATPHRGSFVAGRQFVANVIRRLLVLPFGVTSLTTDLARNPGVFRGTFVPSAVDNMSPRHHFIQALRDIPVAPAVKAHSIIAVEGDGPVEQGDDGVVQYSSAHIEGVESELVVRSTHSTQGRSETIEEVRRILRLHAGSEGGPRPVERQ